MKLPHIQLYPGDWLKDQVAGCSLGAQGLWLRLIFIMHDSEPRGFLCIPKDDLLCDATHKDAMENLPCDIDATHKDARYDAMRPLPEGHIARRVGLQLDEYRKLMQELWDAGVPSKTENGVIFCRRMMRSEELSSVRQKAGSLGGMGKRSALPDAPGFVYAMSRPDGAIKIGSSVNPTSRRYQVQAQHGVPIVVVGKWYVQDMGKMENHLHQCFKEHQILGEWFNLSQADLAKIPELLSHSKTLAKSQQNPDNDNDNDNGTAIVPFSECANQEVQKRIVVLKDFLCQTFPNRANGVIWPPAEEQAMILVVGRPDFYQEVDLLRHFQRLPESYFPKSVRATLEGWQKQIDKATIYERDRKLNSGNIKRTDNNGGTFSDTQHPVRPTSSPMPGMAGV